MRDCLFLPADTPPGLSADSLLYWQAVDGQGRSLRLAECASVLGTRELALVLPMEQASACLVSLPTQKARWLRQALAYAVEEALAEDVEALHLALGSVQEDGRHPVRIIRRSLLQGWLASLAEAGLRIGAIYLDADLLWASGSELLVDESRVLLASDDGLRLALRRDDWPALQARLPALRPCTEAAPWAQLLNAQSQAIDLAQGELALVQPASSRAWRPVAAVLVSWLCLQWLFDLGQGLYLQYQGDQYAQASEQLYRELFPEDRRIVRLRAQFDQHLAAAGAQQQEQLLSRLQPLIEPLQAASGVQVQQLDYQAAEGSLALQVQASDFAGLELLRERLQAQGLQVEMGSAGRDEQGVSARLLIGGDA